MEKRKKYLSKEDGLAKAQRYCAYQDRCHQEVRSKLIEWGVYGDKLEEIMVELIQDRFLDEERFARSYARGKFRLKKWGRVRIEQELKKRQISDYCRRKAMEEIEEEVYLETLQEILHKRWQSLSDDNLYQRKQKTIQYVVRRGYEMGLVLELWPKLDLGF